MADRTNIVVVVVVVVVTNCERMTVVEPMGSSVSSLIARHSGMKMPEPSPRDGGIFSLVVASIRVSARVRRACDFQSKTSDRPADGRVTLTPGILPSAPLGPAPLFAPLLRRSAAAKVTKNA